MCVTVAVGVDVKVCTCLLNFRSILNFLMVKSAIVQVGLCNCCSVTYLTVVNTVSYSCLQLVY